MVTHSSVYMNRFNRIFGFKRGIENNAIEALRGFYLRSSVSQGGMYVFVEFQCGGHRRDWFWSGFGWRGGKKTLPHYVS